MTRIFTLLIFSLIISTNIYSQKGKIKIAKSYLNDSVSTSKIYYHPILSPNYIYQGISNFTFTFGMRYLKNKPHSPIFGLSGGIAFFKVKKITYLAPTLNFEFFYRLKTKNYKRFGPFCKVDFTPYKILGKIDNILSADLGFKLFNISLFGGYNFHLDNKDFNKITNYRIGIGLQLP